MTVSRKMLLETLIGHLDLLESAHPRRASSTLARKTRRYVRMSLRREGPSAKRMADSDVE